jgi:ferredoxin
VKREDLVVIGVRCGGVKADPADAGPLTEENVSARCTGCESREPSLADHVVGEPRTAPPEDPRKAERIAALEAMAPAERWAFWQEQFARCVRCNACREVCPLCTCERCVADKTMPQWIESSANPAAIFAWQMTRAQHHAGRCAACGECGRVCPVDIPLGLLNREVSKIVERRFGFKMTDDAATPQPLGVFNAQDEQEFIR